MDSRRVKKRHIASALVVIFFALYAAALLFARRGVRDVAPSALVVPGAPSANAALLRWTGVAASRGIATSSATVEDRETARRLRAALSEAGYGSGGEESAKPTVARGADDSSTVPRHAVLMAAPGIKESDLIMALGSMARHAPDAVVLLIVKASQVPSLTARIDAPDAPPPATDAGSVALQQTSWRRGDAASGPTPRPKLWLRLYDWDVLQERLSPSDQTLLPPIRRNLFYPMVLDDIAPVVAGAAPAAVGSGGVLFSNLDAAHLSPPHAVLLADARDLVFQADPFPAFWGFIARGDAGGGSSGPGTPAAPDHFDAAWADERAVVVAGEARIITLGQDDWNRAWVSYCYYDLGEAMVNAEQIYCSGTTAGTVPGLRHYLRKGFDPIMRFCSQVSWEKGMDQGIHNVIMHRYPPAAIEGWRKAALVGGPFRPGGGKDPIMAQPIEFLDAVESFQRDLTIHVAHAEDGLICTMALLLKVGVFRDANGDVLPSAGHAPCSIVHQFDRNGDLWTHFQKLYNNGAEVYGGR